MYNDTYFANLPSWSAMQIEDTVPYSLTLGHFEETNEAVRRPNEKLSLTANVLSELFKDYLQRAIRNSIKNELYKDRRLIQYLPQGIASASIDVDVNYVDDAGYGKIEVIVSGPFWLRFFFSGRRAFTISGNPSNVRSHGMLVFFDPQSGQKIVTRTVHMKAIPQGLYVEKALRSVLLSVLDSEKFERAYNKIYKPQQKSSEFYGVQHTPLGNWDSFQQLLVKQLRTVRTKDDIAVYDFLKEAGRGRRVTPKVLAEMRERFLTQGGQARDAFDRTVRQYEELEDKENRKEKIKVYAALRQLLASTKTTLHLSDVKKALPQNLAAKSTAGGIYRRTVPKL